MSGVGRLFLCLRKGCGEIVGLFGGIYYLHAPVVPLLWKAIGGAETDLLAPEEECHEIVFSGLVLAISETVTVLVVSILLRLSSSVVPISLASFTAAYGIDVTATAPSGFDGLNLSLLFS